MERGTKGIAIAVAVLLVAVAMAGCLDDGDSEQYSYDGADFRFDMDKTYCTYTISPPNSYVYVHVCLNNTADDNASLEGATLEVKFYLDDWLMWDKTVNATPDYYMVRPVPEGGNRKSSVGFLVDGDDPFGGVLRFEMKLIFEGTTIDKGTYEEIGPMRSFRINLDDTYAEYELEGFSDARLYVALDNIEDGKASLDGFKLEASIKYINGTGIAGTSSYLSGNVSEGGQEIVLLEFPWIWDLQAGYGVMFVIELLFIGTRIDKQTYEDVARYMDLEFRLNLDDTDAWYDRSASNLVKLYVALDNIADGKASLDGIVVEGQYYMNGVQQWEGTDYAYPIGDVYERGQKIVLLEFNGFEPILSGAVLEFKLKLTYRYSNTVDRQTYEEVVP